MKDIKYYEIHEELIKFLHSKKLFYKAMLVLYNIDSLKNTKVIQDINDLCWWNQANSFLKLSNLKEIPWSALQDEYLKIKVRNENMCTIFFTKDSKKDCENCIIRYQNICKNWFIDVNNL